MLRWMCGLFVLSGAAFANPAFLEAEVLEAKKVDGPLPLDFEDARWSAAPAKVFSVFPQRTVALFDRTANQALAKAGPKELTVRALYSERELGVGLEWPDEARTTVSRKETASFGDAVAVQFPSVFGPGKRLPHIAMGDEGAQVHLYLARDVEGGTVQGEFVAGGYNSRTPVQSPVGRFSLAYDSGSKRWRAVFVRPLERPGSSLAQGLVPVAFAVFDGAGNERGGNKRLSPWRYLRLPSLRLDEGYLAYLAQGYGPAEQGDATAGQTMVAAVCTSCHRFADKQVAPPDLAPGLDGIGGIASYRYLVESITQPSAVFTPSRNPNIHYDKGARPDRFGAYPAAETYRWHALDGSGKKVSKMPPFAFPPEVLANMVAYLKTLKGGAP